MTIPYKLCFLGYKQLTDIAQRLLPELPFNDCEIQVVDCLPDTLPDIVNSLSTQGVEVFIAGGANAAVFPHYSPAHLQEITVSSVDYLLALQKAKAMGGSIAIAWHRLSRELDQNLLVKLSGIAVQVLPYEDGVELYELLRDSDYQVIIGASQACSYAAELGKKSVLVYAGENTVRRSFIKARRLAMELRKEQRHEAISRSLIGNLPIGIIITNEAGQITTINQLAKNYLNVSAHFARGRLLSDVAVNLSPNVWLKKGYQTNESYKIINGIRFRCVQNRLIAQDQDIGVLTTLRIDNARKQGKITAGLTSNAATWKELVTESDSMKSAVALGKKYAVSPLPLALFGDSSNQSHIFAECVHTDGPRAQQPLIVVNLPNLSANDAGRHLLGSSDIYSPHVGLLEMANNGTMILKNIQDACPAVQDILLDVLTGNQFIPIGGYNPIELNVRFITLFDDRLATVNMRDSLLQRLCTLTINFPSLRERQADLPMLFQAILANLSDKNFHILNYQKVVELLTLYSWPDNMPELEAVAGRFATLLNDSVKTTHFTVQNALIKAIGEERLYQELQQRHPCLQQKNPDLKQLRQAVEELKYYLNYSNSTIAEKLGISRSTLWRTLKE